MQTQIYNNKLTSKICWLSFCAETDKMYEYEF